MCACIVLSLSMVLMAIGRRHGLQPMALRSGFEIFFQERFQTHESGPGDMTHGHTAVATGIS